jgi:hypothetical protein
MNSANIGPRRLKDTTAADDRERVKEAPPRSAGAGSVLLQNPADFR